MENLQIQKKKKETDLWQIKKKKNSEPFLPASFAKDVLPRLLKAVVNGL